MSADHKRAPLPATHYTPRGISAARPQPPPA